PTGVVGAVREESVAVPRSVFTLELDAGDGVREPLRLGLSNFDFAEGCNGMLRQTKRDLAPQSDPVDSVVERHVVSGSQATPMSPKLCSVNSGKSLNISASSCARCTSYSRRRVSRISAKVRGVWMRFQMRAPTGSKP